MSEKQYLVIGGDTQKTLNGEYQFDLKALLKQGWALTQRSKTVFIQSALIVLAIAVVFFTLWSKISGVEDFNTMPIDQQMMLDLILTAITAPFLTAMMLMGVGQSVGSRANIRQLFGYLSKSAVLALAALMVSTLVDVGISLMVIPGIYLACACGFTLPLVIEKKLRPSQALLLSVKVFNKYCVPLTLFYILFFLLLVASLLSFGIGFIWTLPWYFNTKGVIYRELFGVAVIARLDSQGNPQEGVFHA